VYTEPRSVEKEKGWLNNIQVLGKSPGNLDPVGAYTPSPSEMDKKEVSF